MSLFECELSIMWPSLCTFALYHNGKRNDRTLDKTATTDHLSDVRVPGSDHVQLKYMFHVPIGFAKGRIGEGWKSM